MFNNSDLNCTVIGRLGADPKAFNTGDRAVCALRVAVNKAVRNQDGSWGDQTLWVSVKLFGRTAEGALRAFRKGDMIVARGVPTAATYTSKSGEVVPYLEISASEATRLVASPRQEAAGAEAPQQAAQPAAAQRTAAPAPAARPARTASRASAPAKRQAAAPQRPYHAPQPEPAPYTDADLAAEAAQYDDIP